MAGVSTQVGSRVGLVLGGAISLRDDFKQANKLCFNPVIIAVNDAGADYKGDLHHWASMHPFMLEKLAARREEEGRPEAENYWAPRHISVPEGKKFRRVSSWGGSSGLLGVTIAFDLKIEKVILCGVPLSREGAHYFTPKRPWNDAIQYKAAWQRNLHLMKDRVRSFSGWTESLLGAPTREWVNA